jgi:hypothetical protein
MTAKVYWESFNWCSSVHASKCISGQTKVLTCIIYLVERKNDSSLRCNWWWAVEFQLRKWNGRQDAPYKNHTVSQVCCHECKRGPSRQHCVKQMLTPIIVAEWVNNKRTQDDISHCYSELVVCEEHLFPNVVPVKLLIRVTYCLPHPESVALLVYSNGLT